VPKYCMTSYIYVAVSHDCRMFTVGGIREGGWSYCKMYVSARFVGGPIDYFFLR